MRKLILLFSFALFAGACIPAGVVVSGGTYYRSPGYVYTYADGSCWIDDYWYPQCPRYYGNTYGYYGYHGGHYYHYPQYRHRYRQYNPPPRNWRYTPPHRGHRYTPPPPRVRDHRNHRVPTRPRTRDHRRH